MVVEGSRAPGRPEPGRECGSGLVPAVFGLLVFLVLLLVAVQVLFGLYARSAVTAAAFDAARTVAGAEEAGSASARRRAEDHARQVLGRFSRQAGVRFDWRGADGEWVALRVRARTPSLLPPAVAGPLGVDTIDRTVQVRAERVR